MTKLIFGCGYLGERVAIRWRDAGDDVIIVTRNRERAELLERQHFRAIVADVTQPDTLSNLPAVETVLYAVGFDRAGDQSIEAVYAGGVGKVLAALPLDTGRFIYISTTGVYGDAGGDWVDEQTRPDPQRDGGRASLAAEEALAAHPLGSRSVILRLAGIYGPGRIPFLDRLRAGEPISAISEGYLNLIHVDDAAAAVSAAERLVLSKLSPVNELPPPLEQSRIYCISDGHPVQRGDYYAEVARIIGAPKPRFVAPDPDSPRAARAANDRRVSNARMQDEMQMQLSYPDYRAGLVEILG